MSAPKRKTDGTSSSRPTKMRPLRAPAFHDLRAKYPSVERLEEHLRGLSRVAVEALVISGAFPEVRTIHLFAHFFFLFFFFPFFVLFH